MAYTALVTYFKIQTIKKSDEKVKYIRKLVTKILNLEVNYKKINSFLKQKNFDSKVQ